jgi:3-oxoacyl-(acyl-carrier-protein) synthase
LGGNGGSEAAVIAGISGFNAMHTIRNDDPKTSRPMDKDKMDLYLVKVPEH